MKLRVHNVCDRETVTYPLPLLVGELEGSVQDGCLLVATSGDPDGSIEWPIVEGSFKVLVRLQPGENVVTLRHDQESLTLRLTYALPGFSHIVRPVYVVCADDDGYFQEMAQVYGDKCLRYNSVTYWERKFKSGFISVKDEDRGGGLALFGTGNLHTWADKLSEFNRCLTSRKKMDRRRFMDDSAYR
ncbi:uncharacterized protein LOC101861936, partial [Aplysia californica]|uniref:Uncharacterized protein LOC101861936 n=1 Tax=Aplysia californica TaxID=6500 RepID=A0ABM0KB53_APLCA